MPKDVLRLKARLPSEAGKRAALIQSISGSLCASPVFYGTDVVYLVVEPPHMEIVRRSVRNYGGEALHKHAFRHWEDSELVGVTHYALQRRMRTNWLRAVWTDQTELNLDGACGACFAGHSWKDVARVESLEKVRPLPDVSVTMNNALIVSAGIRSEPERAAPDVLRFIRMEYWPSGKRIAERWVLRAQRTMPRCSVGALLERDVSLPGCEVCSRDNWTYQDLSLEYGPSVPRPADAVETFECEYVAMAPQPGGVPGKSALPWLLIGADVLRRLEGSVLWRRFTPRPVCFRSAHGLS